jgi:RimJ/RimL family protein N-acetyltransferase
MAVLRALRRDDLDDLLVVQREGGIAGLGHIFPQDTHPFPATDVRERWRREIDDPEVDCFAIVAHDGVLAGFAASRGDELLHFGTAVPTWGTGLAGLAHDELLEHLRRKGFRHVWLRVFEENHRAVRFYTRRGWRPTEVTTRTSFPPHPVLRRFERDLPD